MITQRLNRRLARWALELSSYKFIIKYRPGRMNTRADALSRRPDYTEGKEDNKEIIVLAWDKFEKPDIVRSVRIYDDYVLPIMETVTRYWQGNEPTLPENTEDIKAMNIPKDKVVVAEENRARVMKEHHDAPSAGHPGYDKTVELITRHHWWPNMKKDIKE